MKSKKIRQMISMIIITAMTTTLYACNTTNSSTTDTSEEETSTELAEELDLSNYTDQWVYNEEYDCYELENIVYVSNPTNADLESMNIYVPAEYMNDDGTINTEGEFTNSNGVTYTAETAPIIYSNGAWGYAEAEPATIGVDAIGDDNSTYVDEGYILVCVGSRGKTTESEDGTYTGKSPEPIVDLKAGVRFLKANDDVLAGSSDRIISVGVSAGGALSALLGVSGNSDNYDSYLEEIGAVMYETDDIYASMDYCPITDVENADTSYEWMFGSDTTYEGSMNALGEAGESGELSEFQQALSEDLAALYPDYVNSLDLGLELGEDGRSGSYYEAIMEKISESLNTYLQRTYDNVEDMTAYIDELNSEGQWVEWDSESETATIDDMDAFVTYYLGRMKTDPAFDSLGATEAENEEMGDEDTDYSHFSTTVAELLQENDYSSLEGYDEDYAEAYSSVLDDEDLAERVYLLNPMNYIGTDEESDVAPYFRISVGTQDANTSFGVTFNLAEDLEQNEGVNVDYEMIWDQPHGMVDYEGEFFAWIDEICSE